MNYEIMNLFELGFVNYEAGKKIHNQSLFGTTYICIEDGSRLSFMYCSPSIPSNTTGVDEVDIYFKIDERNTVTIPVSELTIENILNCLDKIGYHAARARYRNFRISDILKDLD